MPQTNHARLWAAALAIGLSLLLAASGAHADNFILIQGIAGESATAKRKNWIEVTSLSYGIKRPVTSGTSRTRANATFDVLTFQKALDKASPLLQDAVAKGRRIPKLTIEVTSGAQGAVIYQVVLKDVEITGYQITSSGRGKPVEEITVGYSEITASYSELDSRGTAKPSTTFQFNVAANK